jgi:hypothetical protein
VSALTETRDAEVVADQALIRAMAECERTVEAHFQAELEARPNRMGRIAWLAAVIASNGAEWPGGMANARNVLATLRCNAAVNLLTKEMRRA